MLKVSTASLTLVSYPSYRHNSPVRRSCAIVPAVEFSLHLKKNGKLFAEEKQIVHYSQVEFVSLAFPVIRTLSLTSGVRNVASGLRYPRHTLARREQRKDFAQGRNRSSCSES